MKVCDNTSVGMIVRQGDKVLLIERKNFPWGFAVPAGHVDEDIDFESAAKRELKEEVGLDATNIKLVAEGRRDNKCRREGGSWHYWKLYSLSFEGELHRSLDETKQAHFYSTPEIKELSLKTEAYRKGEITDEEWEKSPGLEPVMYDWFKEIGII